MSSSRLFGTSGLLRRLGTTVLVVCGLAPSARSDSKKHAAYLVPAECPGRSAWLAALNARMPVLLRTPALSDLLDVHIEGTPSAGYAGTLSSSGARELNHPRTVRGASCEEVIAALSWVGALGLERIASGSAAIAEPPAEDAPAASGPPQPTRAALPDSERDALPPASSEGASAGRLQPGAFAFALYQDGLVPGSALELGAGLQLAGRAPGWQPLVSLGAYAGAAENARAGAATGWLRHWSVQAVGCPWRWALSDAVGVRPCLELDVGSSSGHGAGVANARSHSTPWLSTGAQLRAELVLGRVELGASLGAVVPLWRSHFYFSPDVPAFDPPAVGLRLGSYMGILF